MTRINIDVDEAAVDIVRSRYNLSTEGEAINFALRCLAGESMTQEQALALRGSGWGGDLDAMREPLHL